MDIDRRKPCSLESLGMDSESSALRPFKDRKVWLVVFGTATLLIGCCFALAAPLMFFAAYVTAHSKAPIRDGVSMGLMCGALAVAGIWLGIGSIKPRRWARALLAVSSWSVFTLGVLALAAIAWIAPHFAEVLTAARQAHQPGMPSGAEVTRMLVPLATIVVTYLVLPPIWGLFYSSRNARLTCELHDPVKRWTDECPLPVLFAILWIALEAVRMLVSPSRSFPLFGTTVTGLAAAVFNVLLAVVCAYSAWSLYHLSRRGWWTITSTTVLLCGSNVITSARHDLTERQSQAGHSRAQVELAHKLGFTGPMFIWFSVLFFLLCLGYLLYIRRFLRVDVNHG